MVSISSYFLSKQQMRIIFTKVITILGKIINLGQLGQHDPQNNYQFDQYSWCWTKRIFFYLNGGKWCLSNKIYFILLENLFTHKGMCVERWADVCAEPMGEGQLEFKE